MREYLWTHEANSIHRGLIQFGRKQTQETGVVMVPGLSFVLPHLYFEDIVDERRLREIDLEINLNWCAGGEQQVFGKSLLPGSGR